MRSPLENHRIHIVEEVESTQDIAAEFLESEPTVGAVLARLQTQGRGRLQRHWVSTLHDSLACSFIFRSQADHPAPHLLGMSVAIAAAGVFHCQLKWPNDLVIAGKKLGGILTEVIQCKDGSRVTIVGIGVNLGQTTFPDEIADRAISLYQAHGTKLDPVSAANLIDERLRLLPEPANWNDLKDGWGVFDATPGTTYKTPDGHEVRAIGIGSDGQLIAEREGQTVVIYAADAILPGS